MGSPRLGSPADAAVTVTNPTAVQSQMRHRPSLCAPRMLPYSPRPHCLCRIGFWWRHPPQCATVYSCGKARQNYVGGWSDADRRTAARVATAQRGLRSSSSAGLSKATIGSGVRLTRGFGLARLATHAALLPHVTSALREGLEDPHRHSGSSGGTARAKSFVGFDGEPATAVQLERHSIRKPKWAGAAALPGVGSGNARTALRTAPGRCGRSLAPGTAPCRRGPRQTMERHRGGMARFSTFYKG